MFSVLWHVLEENQTIWELQRAAMMLGAHERSPMSMVDDSFCDQDNRQNHKQLL